MAWAATGLIAGISAAAIVTSRPLAPLGLVNISSSEPPGLYLRSSEPAQRGSVIAFRPPAVARQVAGGRLSRYRSFLKRVAAMSGDRVCSDGRTTEINGAFVGLVAARDGMGRRLPHWTGCRRLTPHEIFVLSNRVRNSFDSRYYGPVDVASVIGVYHPIWVYP